MAKVLVIGLDGVGFDILNPYLKTGELPCLQKFLENGVSAPLRSIIPPLTGPAWESFQTGVNPGEHEVFEFTKRR
jgi:predicted AlkP superfamily phosphohydrolase/phosphomutase